MMTRDEFMKNLRITDDKWDHGGLSEWANTIAQHDKEQRAEIERQEQQINSLRRTLREALQALLDVQNGPPLWKYKADWEEAMAKAEQALKETQP